MSVLGDIIKSNTSASGHCSAGNWSLAVNSLKENITEQRIDDLRTTRWVMATFTSDESEAILSTLQKSVNPRVVAAYHSMNSAGIDLSDPQVQEMIPVLAQSDNWPDGLAEKIMSFGVKNISVVESSIGYIPTAEQVREAYESDLVNKFDRKSALLSVNRRANGKTSVSLRVTEVGTTAGGADAKGVSESLNVADSSAPHADAKTQALLTAINSAIEAYIGD